MKKAIFAAAYIILAIFIIYRTSPVVSLNPVDSTNHGWEVKRNNSHIRPEIPIDASLAIEKYNGFYAGSQSEKTIYLTIDLGYESGNTEAVLDVLNKNNVKATFFITSYYLKENEKIVDRIVREGHSLQNHTANYKHLDQLTDYQVKREIMDLHDQVKNKYGISMNYLRTPYEEWSERVLSIANRCGYKTVFWSVACVDWVEDKDADYIYSSVMNNMHNGAVILVHAVSKSSPAAINMIISRLQSEGYNFMALDF